jgi:hypothetical protein
VGAAKCHSCFEKKENNRLRINDHQFNRNAQGLPYQWFGTLISYSLRAE